MKRPISLLCAAGALCAALVTPRQADACGGCFVPPTESTVVTGHRMALSISPTQAVLWDQIQYAGDPAEFSWVLPVKEGAYIEVASDAFFEALDAATTVTVQAPPEGCRTSGGGGFGCSGDSAPALNEAGAYNDGGVQVLHKGTVGPYDTVTLASEDPQALEVWLQENGFSIPDAVKPTVAAYVDEGFDFIALKLQPNKGVQHMKPVRVISSQMGYTLPLRMVAAGVGNAVEIVLFVIGEGRYQAGNFDNTSVPPALVSWDFKTDQSDYAKLRLLALDSNEGRTWLGSYSQLGALLSPLPDPVGFGGSLFYTVADPDDPNPSQTQADTIAEAYFRQAALNDEAPLDESCIARVEGYAADARRVTNPCDAMGENCGDVPSDEIDVRELACGPLDDVAVALVGLHPKDVTLTRLEANLPVEALAEDLVIEAADDQSRIDSRFVAGLKLNACWDSQPATASIGGSSSGETGIGVRGLVMLVLGFAGLMLASRRARIGA
jgi:hypothetical protein